MRSHSLVPALASLLVLVVYTLTMARDLSLFDSAELALVAFELGLGHPPGQPLHTLVGHLFAHLPGVPPLFGLNFLSALSGALTLIPASRIATRMIAPSSTVPAHSTQLLVASVLGLAALHPVLWEPATRVEVYSLAVLLAVWGLERVQHALVDGMRVQHALQGSATTRRVHPLIVGAALMGLSACANPVVALSCAFSVAPAIVAATFGKRLQWRVLIAALVSGVLGLLPYLYVVAVAGRTDVLVWGAPTDTASLVAFLSGADFARSAGITLPQWFAHLFEFLAVANNRFGLLWLLIGASAHLMLGNKSGLGRAACLWLVTISVGLVCANAIFRIDNPDYHGYLAAPFWFCAVGAAVGIHHVAVQRGARGLSFVIAAALVLSVAITHPAPWSRSRANDTLARDLVATALQAAPKHALVVVESDHWVAPALYLQHVEQLRPDVVVLGTGLGNSSWYWSLLYRAHPDLQPFTLRGPGGRDARIARFVAAHPERPLLVERADRAAQLGARPCAGGALIPTRTCTDATDAHQFAAHVATAMNQHGAHIPLASELFASLTLQRGEDLWRLGHVNAALHVLLAGIPAALRVDAPIQWNALTRVPALRRPPITWKREAVLGETARNLFVAAELLFMAGQTDASRTLATRAAQLDLPEAR